MIQHPYAQVAAPGKALYFFRNQGRHFGAAADAGAHESCIAITRVQHFERFIQIAHGG